MIEGMRPITMTLPSLKAGRQDGRTWINSAPSESAPCATAIVQILLRSSVRETAHHLGVMVDADADAFATLSR